ncbi:MAG: sulfatase-like hydrolase/transferase [Anaerolineae bacterium]|nr:sulfatase-like hydrolase/transferase [Anaerolineae bacterium]
MTTTQPNILFIHSDQHRFDCVGRPLLHTPNLDRLAAEGVNFSHAFCPIPVCVPSRNSLIHGVWPSRHGVIANWGTEAPFPDTSALPTFTQALRDGGYRLAHVGKWQVHPQTGAHEYGFDLAISDRDYDAWRTAQGLPPTPHRNRWFGECDPGIAAEQTRIGWCAGQVIDLLQRQERPFFIQWDLREPHLPNVIPEPYYSLYPPEQIPPWPSFPDPLIGKPYMQAQQRRTWQIDRWTWADWAPLVSRYLGCLSLIDAQIGRLLDALDELGLTSDTLVVYSTDHGDLCGAHGMIDKHYVMYDDVVRVPLIARWPERIAAGSRCDAFIAHGIDLARTFCEVARVKTPETFQGQNLLALCKGEIEARQDIFATYCGNQFGLYSQRMLRDRRWKYVWNATAEDELYDLDGDPGELHNRATDSACREELRRLRHRLVAWMEEIGDPLLNGWTRTQLLEGLSV